MLVALITAACGHIYHYTPPDPVPTKQAVIEIDCKDRYLSKIEAVRNYDMQGGYSYSYSCSDVPQQKVQLIVRER